jgi:Uri superfamily endonuclease
MTAVSIMDTVTILGKDELRGTYILRIFVTEDLYVRFGRFRQGAPIHVPHGEVLYIGSAMAQKGSMTLARRLLRHATRRLPKQPHNLRPLLLEKLIAAGLAPPGLQPPTNKKLFWNIDYLLDEKDVELAQVFILRSADRLEEPLADLLLTDPTCQPIAPGLGAHDSRASTHLLQVHAEDQWWQTLPTRFSHK